MFYHVITAHKMSLRKEKDAWENEQENGINDIKIAF